MEAGREVRGGEWDVGVPSAVGDQFGVVWAGDDGDGKGDSRFCVKW